MKVHSKTVWDMGTWEVLEDSFVLYGGTLALAKGEGQAQTQLNLQNQLTKQQLDRQNSMQDAATSAVKDFLSGNKGFAPDQLAAMKSQFLNSNDASFKSAGDQVRAYLTSKGNDGSMPVGGDAVRSIAELEAAKAGSQSSGLLGIDVTNAQQALQNLFSATNVFSGNANNSNVGTFNGGASDALSNYIKAKNAPGFMQAFAGGLGSGISKEISGGTGNFLTKIGFPTAPPKP